MDELQLMVGKSTCTFDELANTYMTRLFANTVVDVFDQYEHKDFHKIEERKRRLAAACGAKTYQVIAGLFLPPWQNCMARTSNKASLTRRLVYLPMIYDM
jgi:hypothetical protein